MIQRCKTIIFEKVHMAECFYSHCNCTICMTYSIMTVKSQSWLLTDQCCRKELYRYYTIKRCVFFFNGHFSRSAGEEFVLHGESAGKAEGAAEQSSGADVQPACEAYEPGALCWWDEHFQMKTIDSSILLWY